MPLNLLSLFITILLPSMIFAQQVIRDVPYTHNGNQTLDLFLPEDKPMLEAESRPAAIVIHGGGWSAGSRNDTEFIAEWLADQGLVVINADYSLAPEKKWPAQLADVIQGVWWIKVNAEHYNINPNKILAVGCSAGGHLAAMLGQTSVIHLGTGVDSKIHGIVSISGPWNLLHTTNENQNEIIGSLLPVDTPAARALASPIYHLSFCSPPTLLLHGTHDETVPFQQAKQVCDKYVSKTLEHCILVPLVGQSHSWPEDDWLIFNSLQKFLNCWLDESDQDSVDICFAQ